MKLRDDELAGIVSGLELCAASGRAESFVVDDDGDLAERRVERDFLVDELGREAKSREEHNEGTLPSPSMRNAGRQGRRRALGRVFKPRIVGIHKTLR